MSRVSVCIWIHDGFAGPGNSDMGMADWTGADLDLDCSNLVDLLAVSLRNQHLGGSLFGDKMLRVD